MKDIPSYATFPTLTLQPPTPTNTTTPEKQKNQVQKEPTYLAITPPPQMVHRKFSIQLSPTHLQAKFSPCHIYLNDQQFINEHNQST